MLNESSPPLPVNPSSFPACPVRPGGPSPGDEGALEPETLELGSHPLTTTRRRRRLPAEEAKAEEAKAEEAKAEEAKAEEAKAEEAKAEEASSAGGVTEPRAGASGDQETRVGSSSPELRISPKRSAVCADSLYDVRSFDRVSVAC
eukprot:1037753-Prorocentrum_minimum.AAC.1